MGKVILAGGKGFIGQALKERFVAEGDTVVVLTRDPKGPGEIHWDGKTLGPGTAELEGADLLINLAGKRVDCRYNEKNKKAILDSRVEPTRVLGLALQKTKNPPSLWINSSTATIYRHAEDRPMDERTGEIGSGFSVEVAKAWEKSFFESPTPKTRKVALRSAIVLGKGGGVFVPFIYLVKFGLGGVQGNGRQMFSWVHEEDLFRIIRFIQSRPALVGVLNVSAPNPLSNRQTLAVFREAFHRPFGLPMPSWLITIGAWIVRTEPELLLKSRWVVPTDLINFGYKFKYSNLKEALTNLV
jgi:uncharacterized protein (TIGR01777 family)